MHFLLHGECDKSFVSGFLFMELILTNQKGQKFKVLYDECDDQLVKSHTWHIGSGYVRTQIRVNKKQRAHGLHRMIFNLPLNDKNEVDHKNHSKLDNRRENLRECTHKENSRNKESGWGSSPYIGVSIKICKYNGKGYPYIISRIRVNGKIHYLGTFKTEKEAATAYDNAAKNHFGDFANLNFK